MMPDTALVAARFVHYVAVLGLFGLSLFPVYMRSGGVPSVDLRARRGWRATLASAAILSLASGIILFCCVAAGMAGSWSDLDGDMFASVATTSFGLVMGVHLVVAAMVVALTLWRRPEPSRLGAWSLMIASGLLLASLAGTGHTQDGAGAARIVHVLADALHLLGAGAWLGGIAALYLLITAFLTTTSSEDEAMTIHASARFAGLGSIAVATLTLSGIFNAWMLVGSVQALTSTLYGQLLVIKLALFGAMLLFAAINRIWIVPALVRQGKGERSKAAMSRLRRLIVGEQALGLMVVVVVSALGAMEPARNF